MRDFNIRVEENFKLFFKALQESAHKNAVEKGWWEDDK